jgi:hypothetical protein
MALGQLSYFAMLNMHQLDSIGHIVADTFVKISVTPTFLVDVIATIGFVVFLALVAYKLYQNQRLCFSYTIFS